MTKDFLLSVFNQKKNSSITFAVDVSHPQKASNLNLREKGSIKKISRENEIGKTQQQQQRSNCNEFGKWSERENKQKHFNIMYVPTYIHNIRRRKNGNLQLLTRA